LVGQESFAQSPQGWLAALSDPPQAFLLAQGHVTPSQALQQSLQQQ
jgi:hypothetical protein